MGKKIETSFIIERPDLEQLMPIILKVNNWCHKW